MSIDQNILIYILLGIATILFFWTIFQQLSLRKIKKNQEILFNGKQAKDLEKIILSQQDNLLNLNKQSKELFEINDELIKLSHTGLSKVGMVRFNPFKNLGGNQSFSVAFLNSHHNGLVISSLYSNDGSRFYAKTIQKGQSQTQCPLTKEEKQAINVATGKK